MGNLSFVTTSWDDGDRADIKLAMLLRDKEISGSFYIPILPFGSRPALIHQDLRALFSEGFEIGAHGVSHVPLWGLKADELSKEVGGCKPVLEDILGEKVRMFCYPRGRFDQNAIRAVKRAGYLGARTVRMLSIGMDFPPFEVPTTVQTFPHSRSSYFRNIARARQLDSLQTCIAHAGDLGNWLDLAKRLFDSVVAEGGIWHLYGHSWEIDQLGLWEDLEEVLDYVSRRPGVHYVTNGELLEHLAARQTLGTTTPYENTYCP
jgi:peptidoglycan/xylan/chitin deacetylase (PgdA/CDA1 family)